MTKDVIKNLLGTDSSPAGPKTFVVSSANNQSGVDINVMSEKTLKHFKGDVVEALEVEADKAEAIANNLKAASNLANPSRYPRLPGLPAGVLGYKDLETGNIVIDVEAGGLSWTQCTMVDGQIVSAKNDDGTESDMFKP